VLPADRLVVLQLLKDHGAAPGRGGHVLGLVAGTQGALAGLAARQEAHQPGAALVSHRHHVRQPVQVAGGQPTGVSATAGVCGERVCLVVKTFKKLMTSPHLYNKELLNCLKLSKSREIESRIEYRFS